MNRNVVRFAVNHLAMAYAQRAGASSDEGQATGDEPNSGMFRVVRFRKRAEKKTTN